MAAAANAQETRFGVKAGANLANVSGGDLSGNKNLVGLAAGVMADVSFSDLISFHPELLYSQKGAKFESSGSFSGTNYTLTQETRTSYLDLPLLLRVKADGLFFEAGPQVGFLIGQKTESTESYSGNGGSGSSSSSSTSTTGLRKFDVGYIAGVGYQLPMGLEVGVRYNGGISDVNDPSGSSKTRNSVFQFQLGYLFGGK